MDDDQIISAAKRIELDRVADWKVGKVNTAITFEIRWYCDNAPHGTTSHHIIVPADAVREIAIAEIRAALAADLAST